MAFCGCQSVSRSQRLILPTRAASFQANLLSSSHAQELLAPKGINAGQSSSTALALGTATAAAAAATGRRCARCRHSFSSSRGELRKFSQSLSRRQQLVQCRAAASGEDAAGDDFASLSNPNYLKQDEETMVGGWLAHRASPEDVPGSGPGENWVLDVAPLITRADFSEIGRKPRILVLYGSLRESSFSRKLALEFARLFEVLGCDVRTYDPRGLPVRDPTLEAHPKVQELRSLSEWSDGHMWVSPEMHGAITGTFKNQIDWLPLNTGSVRPTQGRTCCVAQVNGGSQSFNVVNTLRLLARWMRMPCCTNQSSVPKAWKEFDDDGRMKDSDLRDRVIDVAEEFVKFTTLLIPHADNLVDRYSERKEKEAEGRLLTQAEKEAQKTKA